MTAKTDSDSAVTNVLFMQVMVEGPGLLKAHREPALPGSVIGQTASDMIQGLSGHGGLQRGIYRFCSKWEASILTPHGGRCSRKFACLASFRADTFND